jgi:2-polyprenyl-3-methyl-5-hydroxy-6-metoxy-1,4-benzoquinol methylase
MMQNLEKYPSLARLTNEQIKVWPEHAGYLAKSMDGRSEATLKATDLGADLVLKLASHFPGGAAELCDDYKYVCQNLILEEELYFRRFKRYRLTTFVEAYKEYYAKQDLMKRYMNGLLLSGIFWLNHANALDYYLTEFLPKNSENYSHLEVGPGHGLLIYFAAKDPRARQVVGWDVSEGSIAATRRALHTIGVEDRVTLVCQDVFDAKGAEPIYDSVVISEVLEHLEDPLGALKSLNAWMRPGARIWVNMPVNSPAPDHLYLLREPEAMLDLMTAAGLTIEQYRFFPMTGVTLERARKHDLTINVAAIGRRR